MSKLILLLLTGWALHSFGENLPDLIDALAIQEGLKVTNDSHEWPTPPHPSFYRVKASEPVWFQPAAFLPSSTKLLQANNNLAIAYHEGRLFIGWRNANKHFPSSSAKMIVASSPNWGKNWDFETSFEYNTDLREPSFLENSDGLHFQFFKNSASPLEFKPQSVWQSRRLGLAKWEDPKSFLTPGEVPWAIERFAGEIYLTSYRGGHYDFSNEAPSIEVVLRHSVDGKNWKYVTQSAPKLDHSEWVPLRSGGASETAIQFLPHPASSNLHPGHLGKYFSVSRNEDGEESDGKKKIGSYLGTANVIRTKKGVHLDRYQETLVPYMYDSPRMFTHESDVFFIARRVVRRHPGGWQTLPAEWDIESKLIWAPKVFGRVPPLLFSKWMQTMRTSLYEFDPDVREAIHLMDLPSAGDTAFPSVLRLSKHTYLVANYTSPIVEGKNWSWIYGQNNPTSIYFLTLKFEESGKPEVRYEMKVERFLAKASRLCDFISPATPGALSKMFSMLRKNPPLLIGNPATRAKLATLNTLFLNCPENGRKTYADLLTFVAGWVNKEQFKEENQWLMSESERLGRGVVR